MPPGGCHHPAKAEHLASRQPQPPGNPHEIPGSQGAPEPAQPAPTALSTSLQGSRSPVTGSLHFYRGHSSPSSWGSGWVPDHGPRDGVLPGSAGGTSETQVLTPFHPRVSARAARPLKQVLQMLFYMSPVIAIPSEQCKLAVARGERLFSALISGQDETPRLPLPSARFPPGCLGRCFCPRPQCYPVAKWGKKPKP